MLLTITFFSCKKKYTYIEVLGKKGVWGMFETEELEPEIIEAKNDSIAYLEAYKKFYASKITREALSYSIEDEAEKAEKKEYWEKVFGKKLAATLDYDLIALPVYFKLINSKGIDITKTISPTVKEVAKGHGKSYKLLNDAMKEQIKEKKKAK